MPAVDQCEPAVIRAFEKRGWVVTDQPFSIQYDYFPRRTLYADVRFQYEHQIAIVIEVKCFANPDTLWDEFYRALGQYSAYRAALRQKGILEAVYMAIPLSTFETFFQRSLIQELLTEFQVKLVIIEMEFEEIVSWIL
jgi:hypothetical protein